ncbi:MAG: PorP/SprF family type IX secretion system membrane protein [Cytophagaceae bacterium]|jgi:type IX secretion system PorP/SprF family membrane protein|nr:PorP/SprF family type IX secretion system membrane protein [Cytophagaceae bacterium]
MYSQANKLIGLLLVGISLWIPTLKAQEVIFTHYHLTPTLVNPALVGGHRQAQVVAGYRSQWRSLDGKYSTPLVAGMLPIRNKLGNQKGGIGIHALSDKAGQAIYTQQTGASLQLAYTLALKKSTQFAYGISAGYYQKRWNLDQASTESQYTAQTGYNAALSNGEEASNLNHAFMDLGTGLSLFSDKETGRRHYQFGVSAFHINRPYSAPSGNADRVPLQLIATAAWMILDKPTLSITPDIFYSRSLQQQRMMAGSQFRYYFSGTEKKITQQASIAATPRYSHKDAIAIAIEFNKPLYALSVCYDYTISPIHSFNRGRGATEVFLTFRLPGKKNQPQAPLVPAEYNLGTSREFIVKQEEEKDNTKSYTLHLQEAVNFAFNDSTISLEGKRIIEDLAQLLKGNKYLKVRIIGHSDNLGSKKRNQSLSEVRAKMVMDYLLSLGIERKRIQIIAKGDQEPLKSNDTEEGRASNRRVEFELWK